MKKSNEFLFQEGKATKQLLSLQGRLYIYCRVRSPNGFQTDEVGEASGYIKNNFRDLIESAKLNAIYKHVLRGGRSGARIIIIYSYEVRYFQTNLISKRVRYSPRGKQKKGTYRIITRNTNGRIISNDAYTYKKNLNVYADGNEQEESIYAFR